MIKGLVIMSIQIWVSVTEQTAFALQDLEAAVQRWWPE